MKCSKPVAPGKVSSGISGNLSSRNAGKLSPEYAPAIYNDISRVNNGLVTARSGAKKVTSEDGDHHYWKKGKETLIDTNNKILIENFRYDQNINLFSLIISNKPHSDAIRKSFRAKDGTYYSFIDYEKEFLSWLKTNVLNDYSQEKLGLACFDSIACYTRDSGWVNKPKDSYLSNNYGLIINKLLQIKRTNCKYGIFTYKLERHIFDSPDFDTYYDGRNESKEKYPLLSLVFNYHDMTPQQTQDVFSFLRTDDGYKMISVSIREP